MTIRMPFTQSRDPLVMTPGGDAVPWPPEHMPFSEDAREALLEAQRESARLGHNHVSPPHIFVGAVAHAGDDAGALRDLGVTHQRAQEALGSVMGRGSGIALEDITLTPLGKNVLERAVHEAWRMHRDSATSAQLLIASVHWNDGFTGRMLTALGVTVAQFKETVLSRLELPPSYGVAENATPRNGPYERFDDDARRIIALTDAEARERGHGGVGTEHLLLALARMVESGDSAQATGILAALAIEPGVLRSEAEKMNRARPGAESPSELAFNASTKLVIEHAIHAADDGPVRPAHLLLALETAHDSIAGYILRQLGATPERIRVAFR